MGTFTYKLKPVPPFRLDLTVWALRRAAHNLIDQWDEGHYRRVFVLNKEPVMVEITQQNSLNAPQLAVTVYSKESASEPEIKTKVTACIEKMLGIKKDLQEFYTLSRIDKSIAPLVERFAGLKPPRFPSLFESLVNAFACQQVSLTVGIHLLNRLSQNFGKSLAPGGTVLHAFPLPEDLAGISPEDLRALGFSSRKGRAIIGLASAVMDKEIGLERLEMMDDDDALRCLAEIRGIGRWSAEYVLLRGLGRINIFPINDSGAQKGIQNLLKLKEKPDYEQVKKIILRWKPYSGMIYFHLLLNKLMAKGVIE